MLLFNRYCCFIAVSALACHSSKQQHSAYKTNTPINVELPGDLGSGHQWMLLDSTNINVLGHSSKPNPDSASSPDIESYLLSINKKGSHTVRFYYLRPFDRDKDTASAKKIDKVILIK